MRNIVFHQAGALGDLFVCFKALYALKMLFKDDKLILFTKGYDKEFLRGLSFIDECYFYEDFEELKKLKADIFISEQPSNRFAKYLKKFKIKKIILHPSFVSFFSFKLTCPFPYLKFRYRVSDRLLKLVYLVDKKHFRKNIKNVDFSKLKNCLPLDEVQSLEFFAELKGFKKIVGINAFSFTCERKGDNFSHRQWFELAEKLSKRYKNFCFVLLNYKYNCLQYNINQSENLKVFVNNGGIASLTSFQKRLDYLISIDTSNVHLCDILQVPSFVFMPLRAYKAYQNATYGGGLLYHSFVVPIAWQIFYKYFMTKFEKELNKKLSILEKIKA